MNKAIFAAFIMAMVMLLQPSGSDALCCRRGGGLDLGCQATGPCNIFCCNCDGKCRSKRSASEEFLEAITGDSIMQGKSTFFFLNSHSFPIKNEYLIICK